MDQAAPYNSHYVKASSFYSHHTTLTTFSLPIILCLYQTIKFKVGRSNGEVIDGFEEKKIEANFVGGVMSGFYFFVKKNR